MLCCLEGLWVADTSSNHLYIAGRHPFFPFPSLSFFLSFSHQNQSSLLSTYPFHLIPNLSIIPSTTEGHTKPSSYITPELSSPSVTQWLSSSAISTTHPNLSSTQSIPPQHLNNGTHQANSPCLNGHGGLAGLDPPMWLLHSR